MGSLFRKIPIFVINLDRRRDRMEAMHRRLKGLSYERFSAVDGARCSLVKEQVESFNNTVYPMSPNEFACILSHLKLCEHIIKAGLPYACILEDDVFLSKEFSSFINDDGWIPEGFDLIKFETMHERVWLSRSSQPVKTVKLHKLGSFHAGTAAYIVSMRGALKLSKILSKPDQAADDLIFKKTIEKKLMDVWQINPALCVQEFAVMDEFSQSDIVSGRENIRSTYRVKPKGLAKLKRELRRPFLQIFEMRRHLIEQQTIVGFKQ